MVYSTARTTSLKQHVQYDQDLTCFSLNTDSIPKRWASYLQGSHSSAGTVSPRCSNGRSSLAVTKLCFGNVAVTGNLFMIYSIASPRSARCAPTYYEDLIVYQSSSPMMSRHCRWAEVEIWVETFALMMSRASKGWSCKTFLSLVSPIH